MKRNFGVIGGDRRQAYLADFLRRDGYSVRTYGLAAWEDPDNVPLNGAACADVVVLPLPLCGSPGILNCTGPRVATADLFSLFRGSQIVLAGKINPAQMREAAAAGVDLTDYLKREEMAVENAVPTAEGAIRVALEHLPRTLCGMECLVIGYGRIGELLAHRLAGLGAHVSVSARKYEDLAWIRAYGWQALQTGRLSGRIGAVQVLFNTVPAPVLNEELLAQLPVGCLCVDLASIPGFDPAVAEEHRLTAVRALSLPGKTAPETAAAAVRDSIYHILKERGDPA